MNFRMLCELWWPLVGWCVRSGVWWLGGRWATIAEDLPKFEFEIAHSTQLLVPAK
jgi:hypothetical protein